MGQQSLLYPLGHLYNRTMLLSQTLAAGLTVGAGLAQALHPDTHQSLLLQGRPQVGLWKALAKHEAITAQAQHDG